MSVHTVTWYFEAHDDHTNARIAELGDGIDECPDKICYDHEGKLRRAHLWRVPEPKAGMIYNSRRSRQMSFTLYKQVGEGEVRQVASMRPITTLDPFKFKIPYRRRRKPVIKASSLLRRQQRRARKALLS